MVIFVDVDFIIIAVGVRWEYVRMACKAAII